MIVGFILILAGLVVYMVANDGLNDAENDKITYERQLYLEIYKKNPDYQNVVNITNEIIDASKNVQDWENTKDRGRSVLYLGIGICLIAIIINDREYTDFMKKLVE